MMWDVESSRLIIDVCFLSIKLEQGCNEGGVNINTIMICTINGYSELNYTINIGSIIFLTIFVI